MKRARWKVGAGDLINSLCLAYLNDLVDPTQSSWCGRPEGEEPLQRPMGARSKFLCWNLGVVVPVREDLHARRDSCFVCDRKQGEWLMNGHSTTEHRGNGTMPADLMSDAILSVMPLHKIHWLLRESS